MNLPYHNVQVKHWNPGASLPLILPINVVCNTDDEALYDNVRKNSRLDKKWMQQVPAHEGVAILCGSGPSIADFLEEIKLKQSQGGKVFAMNGAAKFLAEKGIYPDYQVLLDARIETVTLIGPAKEHLFASQVHPECFRLCPDAKLWQLQVTNKEEDLLPEYDKGYVLIGGAASVGNTATCLAYAMGYRNLHCYGYDSSHREDKSHAFHQKINDGEPCAYVDYGDKTYLCSLTMKLQAEKFQLTAKALKAAGCTISVHGDGLLPDIYNAPKELMPEREKYERMYQIDAYRTHSPGEKILDKFLEIVKPTGSVIDFGCGTGRAARRMKDLGLQVTMLDFAKNSPDFQSPDIPFIVHDLVAPVPVTADYGFCTDVMEHIPPEEVNGVIHNIMAAAVTVFFQICTCVEHFGTLINQDLHLTVEDHFWWGKKFQELGYEVTWDARFEDIAESLFVVKRK